MMTSKSEQQVHLASGSPRSHKLAAQQPGGSTTTCLTSSSVSTPASPTSPRTSPVSELNLTSMPTSPSFFLDSFSFKSFQNLPPILNLPLSLPVSPPSFPAFSPLSSR